MTTITTPQLTAILSDPEFYRGTNFIGFDMKTDIALRGGKANPMQGRVSRIHEGFSGMIFSNKDSSAYENMVNRRRALVGLSSDFVSSKLPWGTRIPGTSVIEHNGVSYLQIIYNQRPVSLIEFATREMGLALTSAQELMFQAMGERVAAFEGKAGRIRYELDGVPIEREAIEGLDLKAHDGEQGGLGDLMKVVIRSPKIFSFTRISMNGIVYNIVNP
jgi:hypothetical protein